MKILRIVFLLIIVVIIGVCGFCYWIYSAMTAPHAHDKSNQFITIEKGSTPTQILGKLASEGIIANALPIQIYLRTVGNAANIQAGEYQFQSPITPIQVLKELEKGETQTTKLTIPEGFTRFDIAKRIVEKFPQNPTTDENAVLQLMDDTTLIKDIAPNAKNLEGYMYPSTYSFPRESNPKDIIRVMVEQFKKVWRPEWTDDAKTLGRTPAEIVTIGSLIETESGVEGERPTVASVIYNRLSKNIPLGIDQTVVYIAKMENRWDGTINMSDLNATSPYNTRKYGGLPPGPISSVSESALNAALHPAQSDYLYYVRNVDLNDGSHWFYSSAAEFEKGKAKYQVWLEQQRQEKRQEESNSQQ
jgi:peptidoglycan lytic transglycosylase G